MTATLPHRDPAGLRPLHHHRVHDRRAGGQPITWPVTPYYRPGRSLHRRDHRPRVSEEGERRPGRTRRSRCSSRTPPGAASTTPPRCSCRARPRWTTATSTPTASATSRVLEKLPATVGAAPARSRCGGCSTGTSPASTCTCARSGSTCGAAATSTREPELFDAHMEEVRSGHDEEPDDELAPARGRAAGLGRAPGRARGSATRDAVVSLVAPDGFPFSVRLPIEVDRAARRIRLGGAPVGVPWQPGLACVTAHDHAPDFAGSGTSRSAATSWRRTEPGPWCRTGSIGGFELPPASTLERYRMNGRKVLRFRKIARAEMRKRGNVETRLARFPQRAGTSDGSPLTPLRPVFYWLQRRGLSAKSEATRCEARRATRRLRPTWARSSSARSASRFCSRVDCRRGPFSGRESCSRAEKKYPVQIATPVTPPRTGARFAPSARARPWSRRCWRCSTRAS